MKKTLISLVTAVAIATPAFASGLNCSKITVKSIENQLPFPPVKAKIVNAKSIANNTACEVIVKLLPQHTSKSSTPRYAPIYVLSDGSVILGSHFKDKKNLTRAKINHLYSAYYRHKFSSSVTAKELDSVTISSYTPKNWDGKKVLYAFVDPLCPFCHMIEPDLKGLADEYGYKIDLIPFIVHGEQAYNDTTNFICNNKGFDDWINGKYGSKKTCKKASKILSKAGKIEGKLGLRGTPTFFTNKGSYIAGADMRKLNKVMKKGE